MITILRTLFEWPQGIVVGNLIASAMWALPAFTHLHWRMTRHHHQLTGGAAASGPAPVRTTSSTAVIRPARLTWQNPDMPSRLRLRLTGG